MRKKKKKTNHIGRIESEKNRFAQSISISFAPFGAGRDVQSIGPAELISFIDT